MIFKVGGHYAQVFLKIRDNHGINSLAKILPTSFSRLKVEMNLCCAVAVRQNSTSTLSLKGGGKANT